MSVALPTSASWPVEGRPATAASGTMTIGDVIGMGRRHLLLVVAVWLVITVSATVLAYYLDHYHALYTAVALVRVDAPGVADPRSIEETRIPNLAMDRYVQDQIVLLGNDKTLNEVAGSPILLNSQWYRGLKDPKNVVAELRDAMSARQSPGSNYIVVTFSAGRPQEAATLANLVIAKYLGEVEHILRQEHAFELADYRRRETELQQETQDLRIKKLSFVESHLGVAGLTFGLNVAGETWQALAAEVIQIEAQKLQYKAAYENLAGMAPEDIEISPELRAMIHRDPFILQLRNRILNFEYELRLLKGEFDEGHRAIREKHIAIEVAEQRLAELIADRESEVRRYRVNSAHDLYLNALQAEFQLREKMMAAEDMQQELDHNLNLYRTIEVEQFMAADRLREVGEYAHQLDVLIKARRLVQVQQTQEAYAPQAKSFPVKSLFVVSGGILGLLLGGGLVALIELTNTRVKTPQDVALRMMIPVLGVIPDIDDDEVRIERAETVCRDAPHSVTAESFRGVRANLLFSLPVEQLHTILVTSARPEEGKTTVALNLATALSQMGRRILLVDANFRRPRLQAFLDGAPRHGLSHVLIGERTLSESIRTEGTSNLHILVSGPAPPSAADVIGTGAFDRFLAAAREHYDMIVIDGSAVLNVTETVQIAGAVDGVVMVCRARSTKYSIANRARETLEQAGARILGGVLNGVNTQPGGYYQSAIRSYYEYRSGDHGTNAPHENSELEELPATRWEGLDGSGDETRDRRS